MGFSCKRCGGYFCASHRLPEAHDCEFSNMSKEELALRAQLEKEVRNPRGQAPVKEMYRDRPVERASDGPERSDRSDRVDRVEFDDDEDYEGRYMARGPVSIDLSLTLLIFIIFAITDAIYMSFNPFMFFAMIVHASFLPFLMYMVFKQRRGEFPPRSILTYLQVVITYMAVYVGVKIIVNLLVFDLISVAINLLIGIFMIFMFNRVLQQLRYAF